jgi:hypothetical protein
MATRKSTDSAPVPFQVASGALHNSNFRPEEHDLSQRLTLLAEESGIVLEREGFRINNKSS